MNKSIVRAARVRFKVAALSRYGATGSIASSDIARKIAVRTGVPVAAVTADRFPHPMDRIGTRSPGSFDPRPSWRVPVSGPVQFVGRLIEE